MPSWKRRKSDAGRTLKFRNDLCNGLVRLSAHDTKWGLRDRWHFQAFQISFNLRLKNSCLESGKMRAHLWIEESEKVVETWR